MKDEKFDDTTVLGDTRLSAWATSPYHCRVQTRDAQMVKALKRLPDCERVGYSVAGHPLWVYSVQRTLPWVKTNVIEKFASLFPKKYEGKSRQTSPPAVFPVRDDSGTVRLNKAA